MSLIYSRPRLHIPKMIVVNHQDNKNNKKKFRIIGVMGVIMIIITIMIKSIMPIFNSICLEKARSIATLITNEETTKVLQNYEYFDFIMIHKDDDGNILMLEANMKNINQVIATIANQIQIKIDAIEQENIGINLGSFTGIHFLIGRGIKIPIRVITAGNVKTTVKSELISQGINQTLHRLYLEIECEISVLTPFNSMQESITNQLILAENVIVGNIPNNYYHLEGVSPNQALELIQ